jgi:hypothetical protein
MIISNQGRSILIRQSTPEDAQILFRAYSDDSFIRLYRSNNPAQSEEQLRDMLKERLKHSPLERGRAINSHENLPTFYLLSNNRYSIEL